MSKQQVRSEGRIRQGALAGRTGASRRARKRSGRSARKLPSSTLTQKQHDPHIRLRAAEEALRAIRSGEVDAFVISRSGGPRVVTLAGGEPAYRTLVEAMSEGAATVSGDGHLLYCNGRLAELLHRQPGKTIGIAVQSLLGETERDKFEALLGRARRGAAKGEFDLRRRDGSLVPVHLSLNRLRGYKSLALGMVITDLSEQKSKQAAEIKRTAAMHRLLLERTFSAQEEERRRIARELHDEAGQLLTSLLVGLRTVETSAKISHIKAQGRQLRKIAARAIEELGRLARGLHPVVLEDLGLGVALARYVAEYSAAHNIAIQLSLKGLPGNLPQPVQIGLYRILQEALSNVARHSGARKVSIRFTSSPSVLRVAVADDGRGFDAEAVAASSRRLGLHGMRERAAMLGGTVSFPSPDQGTRMLVQIPLQNQPVARKKRVS